MRIGFLAAVAARVVHGRKFARILKLLEQIMASQKDAADQLNAVKDELVKANGELQTKIQALTDAATSAGNVTPELQAAIDGVAGAAKVIDDIVPDAPPPSPPAPPAT